MRSAIIILESFNTTIHTTISITVKDDLPEIIKSNIHNERKKGLAKVKQYMDNNLKPIRKDILNLLKEILRMFHQ